MSIIMISVNAFINNSLKTRNIVRTFQANFNYQMYITLAKGNPSQWLDKQTNLNSTVSSCLVSWPIDPNTGTFANPDPRTFSCPQLLDQSSSYFKILKEENRPLYVSSVDIYNTSGNKIAGTVQAPLKLDLEGLPCNNGDDCPMKAVGLMKRSVPETNVNPGDVSFHIVVEKVQTSNFLTNFAHKPIVLNQFVGKTWNKNGDIREDYKPSGVCDEGNVVYGVDSSGNVLCRGIQAGTCPTGYFVKGYNGDGLIQCEPFSTVQCPSDHYAAGIKENRELVCNKFAPAPVPPPPPSLQFLKTQHLPSYKGRYYAYDIGFPVGRMDLAYRHSGAGCSPSPTQVGRGIILPPSFGFSGSTVWVNYGCRADFNIYVYK